MDRAEKVAQIEIQRARIERLIEQDVAVSGGEMKKETRLGSMRRQLERLKVLADINDPLVKKRFEDGLGKEAPSIGRETMLIMNETSGHESTRLPSLSRTKMAFKKTAHHRTAHHTNERYA